MNKLELKKLLKNHDLKPVKRLGQNFLIHEGSIKTIVAGIQKHPAPFVEIGPGLGALTWSFNKEDILLVEKDKKLAGYWEQKSWRVLCVDALKLNKDQLPKKVTLFGNLPYEISASLIIKISVEAFPVSSMIFLIQKEVADRVQSYTGSKNYGLLSVISQTFWDISTIIQIPKHYFYPAPKVNGTVLEFKLKKKPLPFPSLLFLKFIKQCFQFRRKMLFKQLPVAEPKKLLEKIALNPNCRAEDISPKDFVRLYLEVKK